MKRARKVSAVFLGLGGMLLALIGMSLGRPTQTVAANETVAAFSHRIDFQVWGASAGAVAANCIPNARGGENPPLGPCPGDDRRHTGASTE